MAAPFKVCMPQSPLLPSASHLPASLIYKMWVALQGVGASHSWWLREVSPQITFFSSQSSFEAPFPTSGCNNLCDVQESNDGRR